MITSNGRAQGYRHLSSSPVWVEPGCFTVVPTDTSAESERGLSKVTQAGSGRADLNSGSLSPEHLRALALDRNGLCQGPKGLARSLVLWDSRCSIKSRSICSHTDQAPSGQTPLYPSSTTAWPRDHWQVTCLCGPMFSSVNSAESGL